MGRINFGAKPLLYPMPVLIVGTYDENGVPNAMNAAWGAITDYEEISISLSEHKTTENFLKTKAFTVSVATANTVVAADYVGIVSGEKVKEKIAKCGWTAEKSAFVDAPLFAELPFALECRVKSYDGESCRLVGEILNVSADESVLDENGKVDVSKLDPIVYDPVSHVYLRLGEKVGNAFSDGKKLF